MWENHWEGGCWTYHMDEVWSGLRAAYAELAADVEKRYGVKLTRVAAMGFSGMMHGYIALDGSGELLAPFRTWRNTTTGEAAGRLTERFGFNIPQRWSVAHLYQAILNGEGHVKDIDYLTTLAGYVHYKLCGERVLGVGEAQRNVPDRQHGEGLRRGHALELRRARRGQGLPLEAEGHPAESIDSR